MLIVGPSSIDAPLALASCPSNRPIELIRSVSNVAPSAVPQGRQAAGVPLKNRIPRTPLGPSDARIEGTPRRGIEFVCQESLPGDLSEFDHSVLENADLL